MCVLVISGHNRILLSPKGVTLRSGLCNGLSSTHYEWDGCVCVCVLWNALRGCVQWRQAVDIPASGERAWHDAACFLNLEGCPRKHVCCDQWRGGCTVRQ